MRGLCDLCGVLLLHPSYPTAQKFQNFPLRISSVNMTSIKFPADQITFTEEILNGKLHFCAVSPKLCP